MIDANVLGPASDVRPLFRQVRAALLDLLPQLTREEWAQVTAAEPWTVRDVAAHLLGDDVGRLSRSRDGHEVAGPESGETLPSFLNRINDEWVRACARISPEVLVTLLQSTSAELHAYWEAEDLTAWGGSVSWAGTGPAPVWLDCARDFTEDWVHQQQIRDAVGRPGLLEPVLMHAVLDTFLRAMPYTLQRSQVTGDLLAFTVTGAGGGRWAWRSSGGAWRWTEPTDATTVVELDGETLWRLCVRMLEPDQVTSGVRVTGNERLAGAALQILSIIR